MTEAQLLQAVRDLARLRGWLTYHTYRSDRSDPGFPDLVLIHPRTGQFLAVELKADAGRLSDAQLRWIEALSLAGVDTRVWRPRALVDEIPQALTPVVRGEAASA